MAQGKIALMLGTRISSPPVPPAQPKLAPSATLDWTVGNPMPVDPARSIAKPIVRPLFIPWSTITDDAWICFEAGCNTLKGGGLKNGLKVTLGGGTPVVVPAESIRFWDVPGQAEQGWAVGYWVQLDHTAWMAISAAGTGVKLIAEAEANNPLFQKRVLGGSNNTDVNNPDILLYAASTEFTVQKTIGTDGDFTTFDQARADAVALKAINPLERINYEFITSGDYPVTTPGSAYSETGPWTVFTAAPGVVAYLGDGSTAFTNPKWSGMLFRGVILDPAKLGARLGSSLLIPASTGPGTCRLAVENADHSVGTPNPALGGDGSGAQSLTYGRRPSTYFIDTNSTPFNARNIFWKDVRAHDLVAYGFQAPRLVLNCTITDCSGSAITALNGAVHNVRLSRIGGYWTEQAVLKDAFNWTYSGSAAVTYSITDQTGASSRVFSVFYDGVLQDSKTITVGVGTYTTNAEVATWLSTLPNSVATLTTPSTPRAAAFLSIPGNGPAAAIALRPLSGTQLFGGIIDVHANAAAWDGATFENFSLRFFELLDGASAGWLSATSNTTRNDGLIRNCSYYDSSAEQAPPVVSEPGYNSAEDSHIFRQYETAVNNTTYFGSSYHGDEYCQFDKSSWVNITFSQAFNGYMVSGSTTLTVNTQPNGMVIAVGDRILHANLALDTVVVSDDGGGAYTLSHATSGTITGSSISMTWGDPDVSVGNMSFQNPNNSAFNRTVFGIVSDANSKSQSNAANSLLYADAANGDLTPVGTRLQLADGSWAGRYLPGGDRIENGVTYP